MGRDLLYKPNIPQILPDEEVKPTTKDDAKKQAEVNKARLLGQVGEQFVRKAEHAGKAKAYKAAYFNKDISGVREVNYNTTRAASLRGSEGASDLRKVVLPPSPSGKESPEPAQLRDAIDLMGLGSGFEESLEGLLNRQGAWAKQQGITVEMLEARMAQLESMIEARKAAIGRMADRKGDQPVTSVTVLHAAQSAGSGLDGIDDVAAAGTSLIRRTAEQANGMHMRIAKMLGIKLTK